MESYSWIPCLSMRVHKEQVSGAAGFYEFMWPKWAEFGSYGIYGSGLTAIGCFSGIYFVVCSFQSVGRCIRRSCFPNPRVPVMFCVAGFRPGSRACCLVCPVGRNLRLVCPVGLNLCVEQKDLKPCWLWRGPSGALRGSPTPAARKLATLKQCASFSRCRLHGSASLQASYRILASLGKRK